jgi:hypothetical protein
VDLQRASAAAAAAVSTALNTRPASPAGCTPAAKLCDQSCPPPHLWTRVLSRVNSCLCPSKVVLLSVVVTVFAVQKPRNVLYSVAMTQGPDLYVLE